MRQAALTSIDEIEPLHDGRVLREGEVPDGVDVAILGMPYGDPYRPEEARNDQTRAPREIRRAIARPVRASAHYDFDVGGPVLGEDGEVSLVDFGDVLADPNDPRGHYRHGEAAMRQILASGALPVVLGGDHGITTPILRAYDGYGEITVVQIDAHIDWRDEVNGVREGYSSPMRRASEMAHVRDIVQIGMRSQGSARPQDVADALAYGAQIITAYELHDVGIAKVLERIPSGARYYISIDADGLDPSCMPAVAAPAPGGVTFVQTRQLIHGLVARGRVVGMDLVEIQPSFDVNAISCVTAGRLMLNLIGSAVRAGYFEGRVARR